MGGEKFYKCCYCNNTFSGYGNNPDDFSKDFFKRYSESARCCDICNETIVIPRRIANSIKFNVKKE